MGMGIAPGCLVVGVRRRREQTRRQRHRDQVPGVRGRWVNALDRDVLFFWLVSLE